MITLDGHYGRRKELKEYVLGNIIDSICGYCAQRKICIEESKNNCDDLKKVIDTFNEVCGD